MSAETTFKRKLRPTTIVPEHLYVERSADRQLRSIVDDMGRPGYVLVARQMGKTNLLLHMKKQRADDLVLYHDLSNRFETVRQWFRNIIDSLLELKPEEFPHVAELIGKQRLELKLEPNVEYDRHLRLFLREANCRVVIILDEVDSLINTTFSDIILSQIRSMYFSRANHVEYENLTYVLSGVVEPTDLIKDKNISPFNIGEKIYLENFTFDEVVEFATKAELQLSTDCLKRIFHWTNGNPRLTWDICSELEVISNTSVVDGSVIDATVHKLYLTEYDRAPIDHIRTLVRSDPLIRDSIDSIRYDRADYIDQQVKNRLYLAGIISSAGGKVEIANKVVDLALPEEWLNSLRETEKSIAHAASASFASGDYQSAAEKFERLVASNDEKFASGDRFKLAISYKKIRRLDNAIRELNECLRSEDRNPELLQKVNYELGELMLESRKYKAAEQNFASAINGPGLVTRQHAMLGRAKALAYSSERDKFIEALPLLEELEKALDSGPLLVQCYYVHAQVLDALGKSGEALEYLNKAAELASPMEQVAVLLAQYTLPNRRTFSRKLVEEATKIVIEENLVPLVYEDGIYFDYELLAELLRRHIENGLIKDFKQLAHHFASNGFALSTNEFSALKHLYSHFDGREDQAEYSVLLAYGVKFWGGAVEWKERIEVLREIVVTYGAPDKYQFHILYLNELIARVENVREYFGERHLDALSAIGTASIEQDDHRIARRLFETWGIYRPHSEKIKGTGVVFLDFLELQYRKSVRTDYRTLRALSRRIIDWLDSIQSDGQPGQEKDLLRMIRKNAEEQFKSSEKAIESEDPFRNIQRNTRVIVQYAEGPPREKKFKVVEQDLRSGACKLLSIKG